MRRNDGRYRQNPHLLALAAIVLVCACPPLAYGQIFLSPNQQFPQRPRGTLDLGGGVRCSYEGGAGPSLSLSIGAYPDVLIDDVVVNSNVSNVGSQSGLFSLITLNIPLGGSKNRFSCDDLLEDAKIRARLQSLRELADENIISEQQYRDAVFGLYKKFLGPNAKPVELPQETMGGTIPADVSKQ